MITITLNKLSIIAPYLAFFGAIAAVAVVLAPGIGVKSENSHLGFL